MIFAILTIGSCACCGGIYLLLPGAEWRTHESVRGGFKIELPAEPREDLPIPGLKADPTLQVEGTVLWKRGEFYAVMYQDLPDLGVPPPADMALNLAIQGIEADPEVRAIVRKVPVTISGFPAREVEYVGTDGGTYVARFVIAGNRFYRVVGGGRFVKPGNDNVRRFLDSFEVLDRKVKRKNQ